MGHPWLPPQHADDRRSARSWPLRIEAFALRQHFPIPPRSEHDADPTRRFGVRRLPPQAPAEGRAYFLKTQVMVRLQIARDTDRGKMIWLLGGSRAARKTGKREVAVRKRWIVDRLKACGRLQRDLAAAWGIAEGGVSRWLNSDELDDLPLSRAAKLADLLQFPLSDLAARLGLARPPPRQSWGRRRWRPDFPWARLSTSKVRTKRRCSPSMRGSLQKAGASCVGRPRSHA